MHVSRNLPPTSVYILSHCTQFSQIVFSQQQFLNSIPHSAGNFIYCLPSIHNPHVSCFVLKPRLTILQTQESFSDPFLHGFLLVFFLAITSSLFCFLCF